MWYISDNVLVAVAYYIGQEKEFTGAFPFIVLTFVTAACMMYSELCARKKNRKISPLNPKNTQGTKAKNLIISNMIPFRRLNIIFAISSLFTCVIGLVWDARLGIPNLSIQITFMQFILLITNTEAKKYFRRKMRAIVGDHFSEKKDVQNENETNANAAGVNVIEMGPLNTSPALSPPGSQSMDHNSTNTSGQHVQEFIVANKSTNQSEIILQVGKLENLNMGSNETTTC